MPTLRSFRTRLAGIPGGGLVVALCALYLGRVFDMSPGPQPLAGTPAAGGATTASSEQDVATAPDPTAGSGLDAPSDVAPAEDAAVAAGAKGLVIAGVGNGNMTESAVKALAAQAKKGIVCVRSSRVATGRVGRNVELDDDKLMFIASYDLNPQKSRVLLRLALTATTDLKTIQRYFDEY